MPRIEPLAPPYPAPIGDSLRRWMPPGIAQEPLTLFRTLYRHPELASRMFPLGAGLLAHGLLPAIDREIVVARVTARSGCGYEWGVHASVYAEHVGLTGDQLRATADATADAATDPVASAEWLPRQVALLGAVDELHDTARLSESAWGALRVHYDDAQLVEFLVLAGWYRTISYLANGLLLADEPWATPFPVR